jgi:hypothetical protein
MLPSDVKETLMKTLVGVGKRREARRRSFEDI